MAKKILVGLAVFITIIGVVVFSIYKKTNDEMKEIVINEIDMSKVKDGIYEGRYDISLVKVKVEIEVKDHKMIRIDIKEHQNGMGEKAEKLIDFIKEGNTLQIDVISGATFSSQVLLKASENALRQGM